MLGSLRFARSHSARLRGGGCGQRWPVSAPRWSHLDIRDSRWRKEKKKKKKKKTGISFSHWLVSERQMTSLIRRRIALRPPRWNHRHPIAATQLPTEKNQEIRETRRQNFRRNKMKCGLKPSSWPPTSNTRDRNGQSTRLSVAGVTK